MMAYSLTALPPEERAALVQVLEQEAPVRGMRLRPGVPLALIRDALPDSYNKIPWANEAFYIRTDSAAGAHLLHAAGAYYLQEPSAMAAVMALDIRKGQRVLDLCAAPGGKSTQMGGMLAGEGVLVANEIVPSRAKILSQNIERLGLTNAIVTNEGPERLVAAWGPWFDRVLVDAPCSGEGMFRREPKAKAEWSVRHTEGCAARQLQILDSASMLLQGGGLLVYSTCTFNETENEKVIVAFCARHPEFVREDFALPGVGMSVNGCLRLWPHRIAGEGHFVARLRKEGADTACRERFAAQSGDVDVGGLIPDLDGIRIPGRLFLAGKQYWALPLDMPDVSGIRALRTGLALCTRRGKAITPDHALAIALPVRQFPRSVEVSEAQALRFYRGETLENANMAKGFAVLCYQGMALGFVKCVDGVLKNHLPKGLRRSGRGWGIGD